MEITISPADDWHHHLRDGEALATTVPPCAARDQRRSSCRIWQRPCGKRRPRSRTASAFSRRCRPARRRSPAHDALPDRQHDRGRAARGRGGQSSGRQAIPGGRDDQLASRVTDVPAMYPVLREMVEIGLPLLVHSEVNDRTVDISIASPCSSSAFCGRCSAAACRACASSWSTSPRRSGRVRHRRARRVGARRDGHRAPFALQPQRDLRGRHPAAHVRLPILKAEKHRRVLVDAVTGPHASRFFAGTDSAPHTTLKKYQACGCAGVYTAHAALELYAAAFGGGALAQARAVPLPRRRRFLRPPAQFDGARRARTDDARASRLKVPELPVRRRPARAAARGAARSRGRCVRDRRRGGRG